MVHDGWYWFTRKPTPFEVDEKPAKLIQRNHGSTWYRVPWPHGFVHSRWYLLAQTHIDPRGKTWQHLCRTSQQMRLFLTLSTNWATTHAFKSGGNCTLLGVRFEPQPHVRYHTCNISCKQGWLRHCISKGG